MAQQGNDVAQAVGNNLVLNEKIGSIESCQWSMWGSLNAGRKKNVYNVKGSKGNGSLTVYDPILGRKKYWLEVDGQQHELEPR